MGQDIDILIIYANADNQKTVSGNGWLADFKLTLELMFYQIAGRTPNIIEKGEDASEGLALNNVKTVIALLSPSFQESEICNNLLVEFHNALNGKKASRIFKVIKKPIADSEDIPLLSANPGFALYKPGASADTQDYDDFFGAEKKQDLAMKMMDLTYAIYESIEVLENGKTAHKIKPLFPERTIYLAETSNDLNVQRNILKRELQNTGYKVLPKYKLPKDIAELKEIITREIEESCLSIHLIGGSYGEAPVGSDRSTVDIQHQIAAEKSARLKDRNQFSRLIWIPRTFTHIDTKQSGFIDSIQRDLSSVNGAEVLQTHLEDFKNLIREELTELGNNPKTGITPSAPSAGNEAIRKIYLQYDPLDKPDIQSIKKFIEELGCIVLVPTFEGTLLRQREHHILSLKVFDAVIIYQGSTNDQWVKMKLLDLSKSAGFGRKKPIGEKIILRKKRGQEIFNHKGLTVIDLEREDSWDTLKTFLGGIK